MGSIVGYMSVPGTIAAADLSSHQYHVVTFNGTSRQVAVVANANDTTEHPAGILQDDPDTALHAADVACFGMAKAECGGTITAGEYFSYNNDGEIIADAVNTAMQTTANDLVHMGIALEDGVDGNIIDVFIMNMGLQGVE
tara:strand:+ start:256 stop:675 length:420 start_codon:yes stop_codon:yes gene_type:complete